MSFFKIVIMPILIAAFIAFPSVALLEHFGWFDGKAVLHGIATGYVLAIAGLIVGYTAAYKLT